MQYSDIIRVPQFWLLVLVGLALGVYRKSGQTKVLKTSLQISEKKVEPNLEDAYYQIEPLSDFDVDSTEPIKIRPFKPKYHITMALENLTFSELVPMDKTYRSRIQLRRQLLRDQQKDVLAANPVVTPAVQEFYTWIAGTYLPQRYPTMFKIFQSTDEKSQPQLQNLITSENLPLQSPETAHEALRLIGENVDTDFLFLLPSTDPEDEGKYRLEGFITCFPSGFATARKLNLKLADIHAPVPGYKDKLEKSMDRFFANLPVGKLVRRVNWSITTTTQLCLLGGTHLTEEQAEQGAAAMQAEEVDIEKTVLRCERQTLHRLPKSKALVFQFKTYQYGMKGLKDEGSGERLVEAIDGLGAGNAPGMRVYKRQVVWGEAVKEYLTS
ncbi:hypothetical protein GQ43DRAFT_468610 [Delitschia confertaspora ATCC 74209]|uniref:HRQ family protein 2 n=1 Tax=Delitschia confertaspora ATCC 74209 TaxID=1513339 RepID=A0A9P4JXI2_9PLEO|nr:hypothetical protein GQ43DRAFT_468610 [Delitschia confertaspora ATCC 74209]